MRQIYKSAVITLVVLLLCVYAVTPLEEKLRLGKDLRGGVSLVYSVQLDDTDDPKQVLAKTIDVLKRRVDPNGLMEIAMVAQGRDRIEITMPLPGDDVKALKKLFEEELAKLGKAALSESRLDQAMRLPADQRAKALEELSAGSVRRTEKLREAAAAYDDAAAKRAAYQTQADPAVKDAMVGEVASAELRYDQARQAVLDTALSADDVRRVVTSSTRERQILDSETKTMVKLPSPRELAEKGLREAHPDAAEEIDRVIAAYEAYHARRTTLDDPADLIRMLKGSGVLTFRITVKPNSHPEEQRLRDELREVGPRNVKSRDAHWYKLNDIEGWVNSKQDVDRLAADERNAAPFFQQRGYVVEGYGGEYYMLAWDVPGSRLTPADGQWAVAESKPTVDEVGKPAIEFRMSPAGGVLLGAMTSEHVGDQMAVLLDNEVYTAPNLLQGISTNGIIKGDFAQSEIDYIVRVLAGGSLQAKLSPEPISISAVGPELGADNLRMGLKAGLLSVVLVAGFMLVYYFGLGAVAVVSLAVNAVIIMGAMALSKAAFTMPGIAGIILTFGMAVDSNVLVYERMREEMQGGADLKTAVRLGFDKALSSIVDGNVTNLIVCVVLYYTGTPEIRGFAITMGVGVMATLFAALVASRLILNTIVAAGVRKLSMLPMAVPALQRFLEPHVNWMKYRRVFFSIAAVYVGLGLCLVWYQGKNMLDNEFLGGTQVTLQLKDDAATGRPTTMRRPDVQARIKAIAAQAEEGDQLRKLSFAEVIPVDPAGDGVTSDRFMIKTTADNSNAVVQAVVEAFSDVLDIKPPLLFKGSGAADARLAPVFPVEKPVLGTNIDRPEARSDVSRFLGGIAIVLDNIEPPQPLATLKTRLDGARQGVSHSDTLARDRDIVVLDGDDNSVRSAVVLVRDDGASLFDSEARWEQQVRDREWRLTLEALTQSSTPASVNNFSAAIADTFKANAITATLLSFFFIGIYIWVRFKTPRYSLAAVIALIHDVVTVVALLALCEILYETPATHDFAQSIGLLPFKIDLNTVAALLTIAGYSLNDTVVIMDRIRENRGKLPNATAQIINTSINQTFSRTIITGGTTLGSCVILYLIGGEGMRAFAFALITGLIVGTYSSVGIAAPIVWSPKHEPGAGDA